MKRILLAFIIVIPYLLFSQQVFNFSSWNSNYKITGENAFDSFGRSISSGDVNGDGVDDILIGAPNSDPMARNSAGTCYIIFGDEQLTQDAETNLATESADVQIYGAFSNDKLGYNTYIANINNDNFDDIIIAAPYADANGNDAAGKVYIILGSNNLSSEYDLLNNEFDSVIIGEELNDNLGLALTSARIDGDNYADVIVSAPNADNAAALNCGKTYIIFGEVTLQTSYELNSGDADITFIGEEYNDQAGETLMVGNFNGDTIQDIIIGAPNHDANGISDSGKIYLIEGLSNFTNPINFLENSSYVSSQILGNNNESLVGKSIALGDIDFDNIDDIIFSELNGSGLVNVIYGSNSLPPEINMSSFTVNIEISGPNYDSTFGEKIFAGQVNSDMNDDIVIGIPEANTISGNSSGIVMIVYGSITLDPQINLNTDPPDITIYANSTDDKLGFDCSFININNDSSPDLAISAIQGENNKGIIYNLYGDLPFVSDRAPAPESIDNAIDQIVTFKLSDVDDGIDLDTFEVIIGGMQYNSSSPNFSYSGNANEYDITILPGQPFGYDQEVDVTIDCDDLSGWHLPTDSYRFFTIADIDPPFTDLWNPTPDSLGVPVDTDVTFHIYDLGEGVDLSSILVQVQGVNYYSGHPGFSYSGSANDYLITIDPANDFEYAEIVAVNIDATDQANNTMETFSYSFTCGLDLIDPFVYSWDPLYNQEVPYNYPFNIEVRDLESGVDQSSIEILLDDIPITANSTISANGQGNGYVIQYQPTPPNYYGYGNHTITIVCADNAYEPNEIDSISVFICILDDNAPYTLNHYPARFATDVATNTNFQVDIIDELTGVNENSISIILDGTEIIGLPNTSVSAITNGYRVQHNPADRLVGTINVTIDAEDNSNPANAMPQDVYWFECNLDEDPPFLTNPDPEDGEVDVSVGQNIYLEVRDAKTGIDQSTINLTVSGENVTSQTTISQISGGYSLLYAPSQNFDYGETIFVNISCYDLAITPNYMSDSYSFIIEFDTTPPYVYNLDPQSGETEVALETDIYFEVMDDGLGVDETTLQVFLNGDIIVPALTPINDGLGFEALYDPPQNFDYNDEVTISITVYDLATPPNGLINYSYTFTCIDDDVDPPFIRGIHPTPNSINVPINTIISFEVLDALSGIDENSIIYRVNNDILNPQEYSLNAINYGDTTGFEVQYDADEDFQYGESVHVQFYAKDGSSNANEILENFTFTCEADTLAPELIEHFPQADSVGFPNTTLYFHLRDEQAGIDSSTFMLKLNDIIINSYQVSYQPHEMQVIYQQAEHFTPNSELLINLQLDDNLGNHIDTTYTVTILADEFDPYINPIFPEPNSFNAIISDTLKVDILDRGMGIYRNSIDFKINGRSESNYQLLYNPYNFNPDSLGYRLTYALGEETFYEGQLVQISIYAEDIAQPSNYFSEDFSFHIFRDITEEVEVVPNILTLNNDGYNDECKIWINTSESLTNISAHIFSRNGKKIIDLTPEMFSNEMKFAMWLGNDKNGKTVKAGLYIYQIVIDNRTFKGSIVIAK